MAEKKLSERDLLLAPSLSPSEVNLILEKYGFEDPQSVDKNLQLIAGDAHQRELLAEIIVPFLEEIAGCPDPEKAINHFERFCSAGMDRNFLLAQLKENPAISRFLIPLFGSSDFFAEILIRNPKYLWWLLEEEVSGRPFDQEEKLKHLRRMIASLPDFKTQCHALRRFKRREILRIGFRDISGAADIVEITQELSLLADVLLEAAYEICQNEMKRQYGVPLCANTQRESRFAVIGMGKLGGFELNFSSDVDLIFIYEKEGETSPRCEGEGTTRIPNHLYFALLSEYILKAVGEITEEGYCYRVDMRLRPEGNTGPLARSLESHYIYYESSGETWERQALIKARFVAGHPHVGETFLEGIRPLVYRKYLDYFAISEIGQTKQMIDRKIGSKGDSFRQVKLGYGGIREIEFIAQAMQLIYGGHHPEIQEVNTLRALEKLCKKGLLTERDYAALEHAYKFLRNVEHKLQMVNDLQTHTLPTNERDLERLTKQLGYGRRKKGAMELFMKDYSLHTTAVRFIFEELFYQRDALEGAVPEGVLLIAHLKDNREEAVSLLKECGFKDVASALKNLELILEGREDSFPLSSRERNLFANLIPSFLAALAKSPDPDMAINNFERFFSALNARGSYLKLLAENSNVVDLLVTVFGSSEFLAEILVHSPGLLDMLLEAELLGDSKSRNTMVSELVEKVSSAKTHEQKLNALRRYKKRELVRIGLNDLLGLASFEYINEELSTLANSCLQVVYEVCTKEILEDPFVTGGRRRSGLPAQFAIMGLGKIGGGEISYGSDLDLVFVYSDVPEAPSETSLQPFFAELVRRIVAMMSRVTEEGPLYEIDTRLRPLGRDGPLALSLKAYGAYFQEQAQTWERQAFIKARFLAGDPDLGAIFTQMVHSFVYQRPLQRSEISEIARMRRRMEAELVTPKESDLHVKLAAGGIVDIEFIVQRLQLTAGCFDPHGREPNTLLALEHLRNTGHFSPKDYLQLTDAYKFLRRLESRLRIVNDKPLDILPESADKLEALARSLGYISDRGGSAGRKLIAEFHAHRKTVRQIYERIFSV